MKTCPYCHKDLPDDSLYCESCGKSLASDKEITKKNMKVTNNQLKENPRINRFSQLSLVIFLFSLVFLDFVLATLFQNFNLNAKLIFYVSGIFYALAIIIGIMSIVIDYKDKAKGFQKTGSFGLAMASTVLSLYLIFINFTQVIMN